MSVRFFSGAYPTKIDKKNRFVLPQNFRFGLVEDGVLQFTIALGLGGSLAIYRKHDIEKIVEKFQAKQHLAQYQKFFTLFFSTLYQTTCDSIGRVLLPPVLKKAANIKTDIVIAGVLNKIEIWPKEVYDDHLKTITGVENAEEDFTGMMEEAFALLEERVCE